MIPTADGMLKMEMFIRRLEHRPYFISLFGENEYETVIRTILSSLNLILKNNYVEFNGITYLQINGTAMGQSCAVVYAVIYVYELECALVSSSPLLHSSFLWSLHR